VLDDTHGLANRPRQIAAQDVVPEWQVNTAKSGAKRKSINRYSSLPPHDEHADHPGSGG
jgi:hypothetical protein